MISGRSAPLSGALDTVTAVHEVCPPGARYGPHCLTAFCLFLTECGTAIVHTEERDLQHQPGSLVIVAPGTEFTELVGANEPWKVRYLLLEGPWIAALKARTDLYCPIPFSWQSVFQAILQETFRGTDSDPWSLLSTCAELLGNMERLAAIATDTRTDTSVASHTLRRAAERLMSDYPDRSWSVTEMAAALQVTARQFTYQIKSVTGLAPATWMRRQRVMVARRLLENGTSVTEVAARTGFINPYHFSRVFKSEMGLTPSEVRQQALRQQGSQKTVGLPR